MHCMYVRKYVRSCTLHKKRAKLQKKNDICKRICHFFAFFMLFRYISAPFYALFPLN